MTGTLEQPAPPGPNEEEGDLPRVRIGEVGEDDQSHFFGHYPETLTIPELGEFVYVPGGEFQMGWSPDNVAEAQELVRAAWGTAIRGRRLNLRPR